MPIRSTRQPRRDACPPPLLRRPFHVKRTPPCGRGPTHRTQQGPPSPDPGGGPQLHAHLAQRNHDPMDIEIGTRSRGLVSGCEVDQPARARSVEAMQADDVPRSSRRTTYVDSTPASRPRDRGHDGRPGPRSHSAPGFRLDRRSNPAETTAQGTRHPTPDLRTPTQPSPHTRGA